jgi:sorting nexin-1/2
LEERVSLSKRVSDQASYLSAEAPAPQPVPTPSAGSVATRSTPGRGPRTPRRVGAQPTKLESLDDSLGPLGPLGGDVESSTTIDQPPVPPSKEIPIRNNARPTTPSSQLSANRPASVGISDDALDPSFKGRQPGGPVEQAKARTVPPSVSIEQAANPKFDISVGDPHKVGDLTSSHIVYQVRTKVRYPTKDCPRTDSRFQTTSKAYRQPEFAVTRRYRDFLWLYNSLHNNNPGVVVPPPPEKQAVGRFDTNFVESRRAALERMLNKTAAHPILQHDGDLKLFLESDAFNVDVRNREKKEPGIGESKGMFGSIGGAFSISTGSKFIEHDDVSFGPCLDSNSDSTVVVS